MGEKDRDVDLESIGNGGDSSGSQAASAPPEAPKPVAPNVTYSFHPSLYVMCVSSVGIIRVLF